MFIKSYFSLRSIAFPFPFFSSKPILFQERIIIHITLLFEIMGEGRWGRGKKKVIRTVT